MRFFQKYITMMVNLPQILIQYVKNLTINLS